jgi:hypothetical protein
VKPLCNIQSTPSSNSPARSSAAVSEFRLTRPQRIRLAIWRHPLLSSLLLSFAAIGGITVSVLLDFPVRTAAFASSDLKTLFASAWCFARGQNAYSIANVQRVFAAQGIVFPGSWFAHAPVYPPTTLAFLAPLTLLPMVPGVYGVVIVSAVLFALAVAALLLQAEEDSSPVAFQVAIAAVCASCPLLAFALSMGNVSVAASALCMLAFLRRKRGSGWIYGTFLAAAVLLKPHLAVWMLTGMLLLPERASRAVALRAAALTAAFTAFTVATLLYSRHLGLQLHGFAAILRSETSPGYSMSTSSHEIVPVVAQITSLHSLPGFWWSNSVAQSILAFALVASLGLFVARRVHKAPGESQFSPAIGAWMTFGLLATYHRAHDALVLLIVLPWLLETVRTAPRRWYPWALVLLYTAMNVSVPFDLVSLRIADGEYNHLVAFLLLRQAALASLGLLFVLLRNLNAVPRKSHSILSSMRKAAPTQHALSAS